MVDTAQAGSARPGSHGQSKLCTVTPTAVCVILLSLVCVTTTLYFFAPPASIARGKVSAAGVFGLPDAEFDWCEYNFESTEWIAEPFNSATSVLYVLVATAAVRFHQNPPLPVHLSAQAVVLAMIGIGSICFHSTLKYTQQLWDELPMYWLIVSGTVTFYTRTDPAEKVKSAPSPGLLIGAAAWACAVTVLILTTEREQPVHTVARGVLSCSFSGMLVYVFTSGARTARELDDAAPSGHGAAATLFALSFWSFIVGVLAWIVDILFCGNLQNLPIYPNLHSVWHIGSSYGSYGLLVLSAWHHRRIGLGEATSVKWLGGWFPIIVAAEKAE
eukprot:m.80747 g.80747  ORF g.80747 m.80747 type:complete len:330 (+) comp10930_c0_seq3:77-1066(+)